MLKKSLIISFLVFILFFIGFLKIYEKSYLFPLFFLIAYLSFLIFFTSFIMFIIIQTGKSAKAKRTKVQVNNYVKVSDETTGEIIDKINIQTSDVNKEYEMKRIFKEVIEKGYTDDKYKVEIVSEEDKTASQIIFTIKASAKNFIFVNLSGLILGVILLFIMLIIRNIYMTGLFFSGIIILGTYMLIDYMIWLKKGIRKIEIDNDGLNFYFGEENKLVRVNKKDITDVDIFKKLNRRILNIVVGGNVISFPGMTFFFGNRIRIPEDSFNEKEFTEFLKHFENYKKK